MDYDSTKWPDVIHLLDFSVNMVFNERVMCGLMFYS